MGPGPASDDDDDEFLGARETLHYPVEPHFSFKRCYLDRRKRTFCRSTAETANETGRTF